MSNKINKSIRVVIFSFPSLLYSFLTSFSPLLFFSSLSRLVPSSLSHPFLPSFSNHLPPSLSSTLMYLSTLSFLYSSSLSLHFFSIFSIHLPPSLSSPLMYFSTLSLLYSSSLSLNYLYIFSIHFLTIPSCIGSSSGCSPCPL